MNKCVVAAFAVCGVFAVSGVAVGQEVGTGSIKGKISVVGVRSPKDVLVYIEQAPGEYKPPEEPVVMDQVRMVFIPHVLPIVKGTTVKYVNSDPIPHNVMWLKSKNGAYSQHNMGKWGKGKTKSFTYEKEGHVVLLCNVHPEMEAYIVVLQNPFFALVGKEGTYEIKNIPPGKYTVKTWYTRPRRLKSKSAEVAVDVGKVCELDFSLGR